MQPTVSNSNSFAESQNAQHSIRSNVTDMQPRSKDDKNAEDGISLEDSAGVTGIQASGAEEGGLRI